MKVAPGRPWLAVLTSVLLPFAAQAQAPSEYSGQIPGMGGEVHPKVMIILDTSNSMRHLPEYDLESGTSPPPSPPDAGRVGPYDYFNDDYDSTNPTAPCDNRFCIAKKAFSYIIGNYETQIQMGIAGYYQYRTSYNPSSSTARTLCLYDVLSPAGAVRSFGPVFNDYADGTLVVPPAQAAQCLNPVLADGGFIHAYPLTKTGTNPGTGVACSAFKDLGASGNYGAPGGAFTFKGGQCNNNVLWTRGTIFNHYSNGEIPGTGVPTDSKLYVPKSVGFNCLPLASTTVDYWTTGALDLRRESALSVTGSALAGGANFSWLTNCTNNTTNNRCQLTYTGDQRDGTERTPVTVYADAGTPFTFGSRTFSYVSTQTNVALSRAALTDGGCEWASGDPVTGAGDNRLLTSSGFGAGWNFAGGLPAVCTNATTGESCRVTFLNRAPGTTNGTYSVIPMGTPTRVFTQATPAVVTAECSVNSADTRDLPYVNTPHTVRYFTSAIGGTCTSARDITDSTTGSPAFSPSTLPCSPGNVCELRNGTAGYQDDSVLYRSPLVPLGNKELKWSRDGGTIAIMLTAYGQTCPGGSTVGSTYNIPAGTGTPSCSSPNGICAGTLESFDPLGGGGPADQYWYSNTIPGYPALDGGTYTSSGFHSGPFPADSDYLLEKFSSSCPATVRLNANETVGGKTCSSTRWCDLNHRTEICKSIATGQVVTCPGGLDSTVRRFCAYDYNQYRYTATRFGQCNYGVKEYLYRQATCTYDAYDKRIDLTQTCSVLNAGQCNFTVPRFTYDYSDPVVYCQAYGTEVPYTGTTSSTYTYSYATQGGEYLGSVTMPESYLNLSTRNWCADGVYSNITAACPEEITPSTSGYSSMPLNIQEACGGGSCGASGGRCSCRLRWRSAGAAGLPDGGTFALASGRVSYHTSAVDESFNPALPFNKIGCLSADRDGGEVATPSGQTLIGGDVNVYRGTRNGNSLGSGSGWVSFGAYNSVPAGDFLLRVPMRKTSGTCVNVRVYLGPAEVTTPAGVNVCNGSFAEYTFNVSRPAGNHNLWIWDVGGGNLSVAQGSDPYNKVRLEQKPQDFCVSQGTNAILQVRLRSDWYDPGTGNAIASIPYADTWTNQSSKESGWSLKTDGGASDTFVPIRPAAILAADPVKRALDRCQRPVDLATPAAGGLCWADDLNCGDGANEPCQPPVGMSDFTPLYGALSNAKQYMADELAADDDYSCRDYYVVLLTDGLEATPKNYTQSQLETVVTSMRPLTASGHTRDVTTFVLAFATKTTSDGGISLDRLARLGGSAYVQIPNQAPRPDNTNGTALVARNANELGSVLDTVFNSIAPGRYSRSRPTFTPSRLSATGNRVYHTYFEIGLPDAGNKEWRGNLTAYEADAYGVLTPKWTLRDKLDRYQADSSRQLRAVVGGSLTNFVSSNNTLKNAIAWWDPSGAADAITFTRNAGQGTGDPAESYTPGGPIRRSRIGPFVFAAPLAVGPSPFAEGYGGKTSESASGSYRNYQTAMRSRPVRVLVGSNDGFLRGVKDMSDAGAACTFEADEFCDNGYEAWGVVPETVVDRLYDIRDGTKSMVDGNIAVADVCWPASGGNSAADCDNADWRTVGLQTFRHGGMAVEAFELDRNGGLPTPMWRFTDSDLGYTYGTPTIGRARFGSDERWVAFVPGGLPNNCPWSDRGDSMYVVDVETGSEWFSGHQAKWTHPVDCQDNFAARTSLYKRYIPDQIDVETAYFPSLYGQIWAMRVPPTISDVEADLWPDVWGDPWAGGHEKGDVWSNSRAPLWYVDKGSGQRVDTGCKMELGHPDTPSAALPADAGIANCSELNERRPFWAQARVAVNYDVSGSKPDLYIGTGDAYSLDDRSKHDYFFAMHDEKFDPAHLTPGRARDGAKWLWAVMFDQGEKVVSAPAFVGGSLILATYFPPPPGTWCRAAGDAFLYAFDPVDGKPRKVLLDPTDGQFKSVIRKQGAGVLSDLVSVNGRLYASDSVGGVTSVEVKPVGLGGRVQGWRRVK